MKNMRVISLLLAIFATSAIAGEASKAPTAQITAPPRTIEQLGFQRAAAQDSTLSGGSAYGGSDSSVAINACMINPNQAGCPGYCTSNPSAPGCGGGAPPPACPNGTTWNGTSCVPVNGGGPDLGHCGMPADWGPNGDPNCFPVQGGWRCNTMGAGTIYYVCP